MHVHVHMHAWHVHVHVHVAHPIRSLRTPPVAGLGTPRAAGSRAIRLSTAAAPVNLNLKVLLSLTKLYSLPVRPDLRRALDLGQQAV